VATIQVGDVSCEPGATKFGKLVCGYVQDGSAVSVPIIMVNGSEDGPVLWLGSTVHGNEIPGCEVIRRLTREVIDARHLRGAIIAAPIQNILAYRASGRFTPHDGVNMNRVFPGKTGGSLTERMAHVLFSEGIAKADYVLDYHSNSLGSINFTLVRLVGDEEIQRRQMALAEAYGVTIALSAVGEAGLAKMLQDAALEAGKPALTVELDGEYLVEENSVRSGVKGTLNIMKHLGMIPGTPEPQTDVPVIKGILSNRAHVTVNKGGLVRPLKAVGDKVAKGEPVVNILDLYGDTVEVVHSPIDGYVITYPHAGNHAVVSGDQVVFVFGP
jgi:predicted deacylase